MKKMKMIYNTLMLIPIAVTLIGLHYLPERIPTHYNLANQADRWGSKYELLAFPILVVFFGIFMRVLANYHKNQEKFGSNNERICFISGIICMITFSFLNYYFLYVGSKSIENISILAIDLEQFVFAMLGIVLIIIGNILPKIKMNSVTGLRTRWSMKNEVTWKKSQFFGGVSFLITGFIIVIISFITKGIKCMILSLVIFGTAIIIDIFYTYWIAKKNN
ncbi:immunity protein SdpI [Lachnospiraceae bacterium]|nr:immunity protein SdpI [Lachnospiraceae bacterium]